jgi:RNA polymerase sigma-70 factor, ECF subfamily
MISAEARGAWKDIEQRLRPYVQRRVPSAADVDDTLQDIFVHMHRGLANLRDGESFGGWIYRIAQNTIVDRARAQARNPTVPSEHIPEPACEDVADSSGLESSLGECVALFVARLPQPYREALTLTELQGSTQKDAADMLGVSLPALKSRVLRGREKIREMFEECCRISLDCRGRVMSCEPRPLEQIPEDCREAAACWQGTSEKR